MLRIAKDGLANEPFKGLGVAGLAVVWSFLELSSRSSTPRSAAAGLVVAGDVAGPDVAGRGPPAGDARCRSMTTCSRSSSSARRWPIWYGCGSMPGEDGEDLLLLLFGLRDLGRHGGLLRRLSAIGASPGPGGLAEQDLGRERWGALGERRLARRDGSRCGSTSGCRWATPLVWGC